VNPLNNSIVYQEYDNVDNQISEAKTIQFTDFNIYQEMLDKILNTCYNQLQSEKFTDFIAENNDQNWLFDTRHIRVFVPNQQISKSFNEEDSLNDLMTNIKTVVDSQFRIKTENGVVIYLEELYPEHKTLLESYKNIIIENKE